MAFTNEAGDGSSWPATVEKAENGDGTSSFWANTFVPLLNRTAYLYDLLTNGLRSGQSYKLSSRSVTRSALGIFNESNTGIALGDVVVTSGHNAVQQLDLPHGATLTAVALAVDPTNATPPAGNKIKMSITKRTIDGTNATTDILANYTDPATSTAYGAAHAFTSSAMSEVIDRTAYTYYVLLVGESSTGADNCLWSGTTWTCTITGIDDGVS